jgi:hypothetical protein
MTTSPTLEIFTESPLSRVILPQLPVPQGHRLLRASIQLASDAILDASPRFAREDNPHQ